MNDLFVSVPLRGNSQWKPHFPVIATLIRLVVSVPLRGNSQWKHCKTTKIAFTWHVSVPLRGNSQWKLLQERRSYKMLLQSFSPLAG